MYIAEPKRPQTGRHPLWSLGTLKEELRSQQNTLTEICKKYAEDPDRWRGLYGDIYRWRRSDQELEQLIKDNTLATDSKKRKEIKGGRPPLDAAEEHADWKQLFCLELLRTNSRVKAAEVTPYGYEYIYKMLNPGYSEHDKDFAELVHLTERRMVAEAEGVMWNALYEAKTPKDKAYVAEKILRVRDRDRWGERLDVNVQGTVVNKFEVNRQKLIAELAEDQQRFFNKHRPALPAGDVVEAEVVSNE